MGVASPSPSRAPAVALAALAAALLAGAAGAEDRPTASIRGGVVSGDHDLPCAGQAVTLLREGAAPRTTTTDGWGRFEFANVEPGVAHALVAESEGCAREHLTGVVPLAGEVRYVGAMRLAPPARFTVHVRDSAGRPVEGAVVDAFRDVEGPLHEFTSRLAPERPAVPSASLRTGADGRASFDVAPGANFTFAAAAPGTARVAQGRNFLRSGYERDVVLVLPAPAPLAGRVLDADGRPVPGALVAARIAPRVWDWKHGEREEGPGLWQRTEADEEGRYSFDSLAPGEVEVLAGRAEGRLCGVGTVDTQSIDEFDLTLPATATVRGRVTDTATGAPVAGAVVAWREHWGGVARMAVTDRDGAYALEAVQPGSRPETWVVLPDGWTGERRSRPWSDDVTIAPGDAYRLDWTACRAALVEGRVTYEGHGVAGAAVAAFRASDDGKDWRVQAEGVTDAEGHYRIDGVEPGTLACFASFPGESDWRQRDAFRRELRSDAAARARQSFTVESGRVAVRNLEPVGAPRKAGETAEDEIRRLMEQADEVLGTDHVRVVARVTTSDGLPLDRALARAEHGEVRGLEFWGLDKGWHVGADGTWRDDERWWSADDRLFVLAWDANHDVAIVEVPRGKPDEREAAVDVVLPPIPELAARVVCDGEPVAGATVRRGGILVARSGPDGRFDLRQRRGRVNLAVTAPGHVRKEFKEISVPHEGVLDLGIERATSIAGVVTDADGRPLAGIRVTPLDEDAQVPVAYDDGRAPVTDAQGRFRFEELPAGEYRLTVSGGSAGAVATKTSEPFPTGTETVRLVARPGRTIAGRVVDPQGRGVARVEIECAGDDEATRFEDDRETSTDPEGRFRLDGLLPGRYRLDVLPRERDELVQTRVRLDAGKEDTEIALASVGVLAGVVVSAEGAPMARAAVEARRLDAWEEDVPKWPGRLESRTGTDGSFRILVPPGGRYAVRFRENSDEGRDAVLRGADDVRPPATDLRLVTFRGEAVGGIVLDEEGTPVWSAEVTVRPKGGKARRVTTVGDGKFRVPGLDAGVADVEVHPPGRVPRLLRDVRIGRTDLVVTSPRGTWIAGRLLDAAGQPAVGWTVRALRADDPSTDLWRDSVMRSGDFGIYGLEEGEWTLDAVRVEGDPDGDGAVLESVPLGKFPAGTRGLELRLPE